MTPGQEVFPQQPDQRGEPKTSWFDDLLEEMGQRAEATLAEFMAQDPDAIDIADRVPYLPRIVLDRLAQMKDQLNAESRAAIENWQAEERQRHREMWEAAGRSHIAFLQSLPRIGNRQTSSSLRLKSLKTCNSTKGCHSLGYRQMAFSGPC